VTDTCLLADIEELNLLLTVAKRPTVQRVLNEAITRLQATVAPSVTTEPAAAPVATIAPTRTVDVIFRPIGSYGWEQNKEFVEVMILSGIDGVGLLPKEAVTCEFTPTSFDLKIFGLGGDNYRLRVTNLDKDIVPNKSKLQIKKNRVVIQLKKQGEYDHWMDLVAKKLRKPEEEKKKSDDPSASIMDMMRDMYENGDAGTKKVIAEAWTKSREQQRAGGGLGAGGFGKDMGMDDDFDV
jgi:calcyclin binding protein